MEETGACGKRRNRDRKGLIASILGGSWLHRGDARRKRGNLTGKKWFGREKLEEQCPGSRLWPFNAGFIWGGRKKKETARRIVNTKKLPRRQVQGKSFAQLNQAVRKK